MINLPDLFDLNGRVAIVTGGAGLLGLEFCQTLARAGAKVVVADQNLEAVAKAVVAIHELWPDSVPKRDMCRALGFKADVTSPTSVSEMVRTTLETFGRLDILVNSAAVDPKFDGNHVAVNLESFEEFPLEAWKQALEVNLTGMFLCCQAAVPPMLDQGKGVIVNLCSIYGLVGPDQRIYQRQGKPDRYKPVYYSVTKAGVLGLTKYLATYYAGKNIRVNSLTPGGVYNGHDEEFVKAYSARTVLGRMADKGELNGALLFLVSDASSYMTGANLVVDGGWTAW